ncbi:hypothetical protein AVEN_55099-1, partial [Araneus ventricosus]
SSMIRRYWASFSILPVMVLNNAWLEASRMAVGDGTHGATTNSGGPARYSASWVGQMMSLVAPRQFFFSVGYLGSSYAGSVTALQGQ